MEANFLFEYFKEFKDQVDNFRSFVTVAKTPQLLSIKQIFQGKIELDQLGKLFDDRLFEDENSSFYISELTENKAIKNKDEFFEKINKLNENNDPSSLIACKFIWLEMMPIPIRESISVTVVDSTKVQDLTAKILSELLFQDITGMKVKINVVSKDKWDGSSWIINFTNNYVEKVNVVDYVIELCEIGFLSSKSILSFEGFVPTELMLDCTFSNKVYVKTLGLIFDGVSERHLQIYKNELRSLNTADIPEIFEGYADLTKVITYIFDDGQKYRAKMTILKNIIFDLLTEENSKFFSQYTWEKISEQIELEYRLFVDDEVNKFVKEKKEVIKEQFNLANQVNSQITSNKKTLLSNLVYSIGIFLSKFVLEGITGNNFEAIKYVAVVGSVFAGINLILFYQSGEESGNEKFLARLKIINTYYPRLYLTDVKLIKDLNDNVTTPEISELESIIKWSTVIYWITFISFTIWSYVLFFL